MSPLFILIPEAMTSDPFLDLFSFLKRYHYYESSFYWPLFEIYLIFLRPQFFARFSNQVFT